MYTLKIDKQRSLSKLTVNSEPSAADIRAMLADLEKARQQYPSGHKLWIVLPAQLRSVKTEEIAKIDLATFSGKVQGLQQVVIQAPADDAPTHKTTTLLQSIYLDMDIPVHIAHSEAESRRVLGILWN